MGLNLAEVGPAAAGLATYLSTGLPTVGCDEHIRQLVGDYRRLSCTCAAKRNPNGAQTSKAFNPGCGLQI